MFNSTIHKTRYCLFIAIMGTRKCHNVAHFVSCYVGRICKVLELILLKKYTKIRFNFCAAIFYMSNWVHLVQNNRNKRDTHTDNSLKGCRFLGAFAKLRKATNSFVISDRPVRPSVYPHGRTRFPLNGFWLNLVFKTFSNICRETTSSINIRQK
jgi:hypothetical protein